MKAPLALLIALAAASATAQGTKTPAPDAKAANKTAAPQAKAPDAKAPVSNTDAKAAPANTKADTKGQTKAGTTPAGQATGTKVAPGAAGAGRQGVVVAPPQAPQVQTPTIMRELFTYQQDSRRDPFFSLLTSAELRPTVEDLRLTGILYDETGRNSYATMRDLVTDAQYRVTTGQILGRMRVVLIKRTVVMFSIEEFGLNRQDSLFLGDTTKVRAK